MTRVPDSPEVRVVDVDGPVHYREVDGPPERTFVLVHGLGGAHVNWSLVAPGLAPWGRVVVPDLPGFGLSPLGTRSARLSSTRRVLSRFLSEVATGDVIVAGNSMGGGLAMLQAAYEPASVAGLVLTGSVFPPAVAPRSDGRRLPSPIVLGAFALYRMPWLGELAVRQRFERVSAERMVDIGFRITTAHPERIPPDVVQEHVRLVRQRQHDPDGPQAFVEAARSLMGLGSRPALSRRILDALRCPVLVVHGRRDRLVPVAFAEAAVREHPTWAFRILPDVGHVPQLEAPERWLAAVAEWLG